MVESLFVISLPRSLSSFVYQVSHAALGLQSPSWTTDGEIMNAERFVLCREPNETGWPKFTQLKANAGLSGRLRDFLDQVTIREGFAYKDVIQPFVVSDWLRTAGLKVLKINRNLTDVAFSMLNHKWFYPASAARGANLTDDQRLHALVDGLWHAQRVQLNVPGEVVDFDDLITDRECFRQALCRLYPDHEIPRFEYFSDAFCRDRYRVLARRSRQDYLEIEKIVRKVTAHEPV